MHTIIAVIGYEDIERAMAPYNENLEVARYYAGPVLEYEKETMLDYYKNRGEVFGSFEECYAKHGQEWNDKNYVRNSEGVWQKYSTYNPESHWDWWQIGGRWAGKIELKEGADRIAPPNFSWGWSAAEKQVVLNAHPRRADMARIKDIANLEELTAGGVLMDGVWEEFDGIKGRKVLPYLEGLPEDTMITFVDTHI